jgi:hypothetical protein
MKDKSGNRHEMMIQDDVEPELLAGVPTKKIPRDLGGYNSFDAPLDFPNETFV